MSAWACPGINTRSRARRCPPGPMLFQTPWMSRGTTWKPPHGHGLMCASGGHGYARALGHTGIPTCVQGESMGAQAYALMVEHGNLCLVWNGPMRAWTSPCPGTPVLHRYDFSRAPARHHPSQTHDLRLERRSMFPKSAYCRGLSMCIPGRSGRLTFALIYAIFR